MGPRIRIQASQNLKKNEEISQLGGRILSPGAWNVLCRGLRRLIRRILSKNCLLHKSLGLDPDPEPATHWIPIQIQWFRIRKTAPVLWLLAPRSAGRWDQNTLVEIPNSLCKVFSLDTAIFNRVLLVFALNQLGLYPEIIHFKHAGDVILQRWAAQHVFRVRNTQFHSFVFVVRKTQLRRFSKFASALCAIPQLRTLPLRTITVRKK